MAAGVLGLKNMEEPRVPPLLFSVMNRQKKFIHLNKFLSIFFLSSSTEENSSEHEPYTFFATILYAIHTTQ
jgi:hypothetical protein